MLFVGVVGWAYATTAIRFDDSLHGDEPKYLRYGEVWYQGQGLDISQLRFAGEQPLDAAPRLLQNLGHLPAAVRDDSRRLVQDLRDFASDPSEFRWNRALGGDGSFLNGIHGGAYQVHSPGVSVILFPGYFLDRYLLNSRFKDEGRWPAELFMTNLMMLVTYGICAVVMFRLLRNALGSESLGFVWAAIAMLTLPTAAFAFQLYPEIPSLLIVLAVSNYLFFSSRSRTMAAVVAGAATGTLAWMHVRFLLVCVCLVVAALLMKKGKAGWAFAATCGLVVLSVLAFNYHVTGSWWPSALWEANGRLRFDKLVFILNFLGYQFDADWGLLPHSLMLLLALPGLLVLGRQSLPQAAFVGIVVVTLVATASGHTLFAARTTPDRLVLSVVPLLFWPAGVVVRRFWASRFVRAAVVVLGVMSLQAAVAYNWSHLKAVGAMRDASRSGWAPNLAFPIIRGEEIWSTAPGNLMLFFGWAGLIAGLSWLALVRSSPQSPQAHASGGRPGMVAAGVLCAFLAGFTVASAATGRQTSGDYRLDDGPARTLAARALVARDRCLCFTSLQGRSDWTKQPNSANGAVIGIDKDDLDVTLKVVAEGDGRVPAFGRLRVEFGDGEETPWSGLVGASVIPHTYRRPGTYAMKVWLRLPGESSPRLYDTTVEVSE
jgi:hypothetical protein